MSNRERGVRSKYVGILQVKPWDAWPGGDGRPIAILPFELADLAQRYGLELQGGIDDLGPYQLAAIQLSNGDQAWILKHDDDPHRGVEVHVDADSDVLEAQSMLLDALEIEHRDLLWAASPNVRRPLARSG